MIILPNKHAGLSKSGLGVGAILLGELDVGRTVSELWEGVRKRPEILTFERFVLGLDMLFALGLVVYDKRGLVEAVRR